MPRKYVKKMESKGLDDDDLIAILKAIKIEKSNVFAVARQYEIPKTNVYRLVQAFEDRFPKGEEITEEKLNMEEPITQFNATECNTCHQPFHLACIKITGSYFTCANCDSDLDD